MRKILFFLMICTSCTLFAQKEGLQRGPGNGGPGIECFNPDETMWFQDADGDGYGNPNSLFICSINQPVGYVDNSLDCDDNDPNSSIQILYYQDNDGDGFGVRPGTYSCTPLPNLVTNDHDCNDNDPNITDTGITVYLDLDNDGFGDPNNSFYTCFGTSVNGYVSNNLDNCPTIFGQVNGCPPGGVQENLNWIAGRSYNLNGGLIAYSKTYYDELGKQMQAQSVDIITGKTWASHTMYDTQGRAALQSLASPIDITTGEFLYTPDFIKKTNGQAYIISDFDSDPENPLPIGDQVNSLGWYYSENNTSEPYQDITDYPFSRTVYSELNPGSALKVIGGNKVTINNQEQWLNGFTYTMPAAQEMYYVFGKGYFGEEGVVEENETVNTKFYKTVAVDVNGVEAVVFTDGEGKTLASARSGGNESYEVVSVIREQRFVDIHIPKGITNSQIEFLKNSSETTAPYTVYDLRTEQTVTLSQVTGGNFYRVHLNDGSSLSLEEPIINSNGVILYSGDNVRGIRYRVNYYDYVLNYYDKVGRLIKSTQPIGFNESAFDLMAELPDHNMETTYEYNALGQLLNTSSPDEGDAQFIYREDGQIRFSQNTKQAENNEFSYTDYDQYARPIESGVYDGVVSFGSSSLIPITLTDQARVKIEGNRIIRTYDDNWNSGIATVKEIDGNGYIEWKFPNLEQRVMVGLSPTNVNQSYNTIKYAIYGRDNEVKVYENGVHKGTFGTFVSTDIFKIERVGSAIHYKKNNITFYTSTVSFSGNLLGDIAFHTSDSKVLDFEMGGNAITPSTVNFFKNLNSTSVSGNTITKNAGTDSWNNGGANTTQVITGDGSIEFKASQTNKYFMAGLSAKTSATSAHYGFTNYAIYCHANGNLVIYESGNSIGGFGTYSTSDVFKIERLGNLVKYYKNGTVFYTSTLPSVNEDLVGDFSIRSLNASINSIQITGGDYTFTDYYNTITVNNEIKKNAGYGWYSAFASNETINGDGFVKFTTPKNTDHYMIGLSEDNSSDSYNTIDFAIYLNRNQRVYVYESGSWKGQKSTYLPGDTFKVERVGSTIRYYKNDAVIYTSANTSSNPLLIDASLHDLDSSIEDLQLHDILDPLNPNTTLNPDTPLDQAGRKERHYTEYDVPDTTGLHAALIQEGILTLHYPTQNFVAGNVSKTYTDNPKTTTTWYSYDIYGRVEWLVQKIEGLGVKTIDYVYDFASPSLVREVHYQKHIQSESFSHFYKYDQDGSLTQVLTSAKGAQAVVQAEYEYYETGALKRTMIGGSGNTLQGTDYVYNLAGQLKAINHPSLTAANDPGGDASDVFGMHIDYYSGDYLRTNTPKPIVTSSQGDDRFDGNIKATRWATKNLDANSATTQNAYTYTYNDNRWLTEATYGSANNSGIITPNTNNDYKVSNLTYDANGNLLSLNRNKYFDSSSSDMDEFTYNYNGLTNQLNHVTDAITAATNVDDLKTQQPDNYEYNSIGQLVKNTEEGVEYIYNASGLVTQVKKDGQVFLNINYDDKGKRVRKEVTYDNGVSWQETYYVRDAAGSVMAVYGGNYTNNSSTVYLKDNSIFGLSRLGNVADNGKTFYELKDHLGSVKAVITKNLMTGTAGVYEASDYYPFGMPMPNRQIIGGEPYRYKFQGQEKDPETGKEAFELRLWDGRIGRWLTTDPYGQFSSPYLGMGNNPISMIDPDGGFTWLGSLLYKWKHGGERVRVKYQGTEEYYWKVIGGDEADIAVGRGAIKGARGRLRDRLAFEFAGEYARRNGEFHPSHIMFDTDSRLKAFTSHVSMAFINSAPPLRNPGTSIASNAGQQTNKVDDFVKLLNPIDEFDAAIPLYRGFTGTEKASQVIFYTDDAAVAATYVKNGMSVHSINVSQFALSKLEQGGNLIRLTGKHGSTGITNTEYQFIGKDLVQAILKITK